MIYTHVTAEKGVGTKSPLDVLAKELEESKPVELVPPKSVHESAPIAVSDDKIKGIKAFKLAALEPTEVAVRSKRPIVFWFVKIFERLSSK